MHGARSDGPSGSSHDAAPDAGSPGDPDGPATRRPGARIARTLVRLRSSQAGVPEGEPLALVAEVRSLEGDVPGATGSVLFRSGAVPLGSAPLDAAGQAVLDGLRLPVGVHALSASYPGDARHAAAASTPLPQAVTAPAAPVLLLVADPVPRPDGVLLQAELVDPGTGRLVEDATGEVLFHAGRTVLASVAPVAGHARAVVAALPRARLRAAFAGDPEHAPATGRLGDAAAATPSATPSATRSATRSAAGA